MGQRRIFNVAFLGGMISSLSLIAYFSMVKMDEVQWSFSEWNVIPFIGQHKLFLVGVGLGVLLYSWLFSYGPLGIKSFRRENPQDDSGAAAAESELEKIKQINASYVAEIKTLARRDAESEGKILHLTETQKSLEAERHALSEKLSDEIARRQQIQGTLEALEYKYRSLLDGVSDSVIFTSTAGIIEFVSPSTAELFGSPAEDFLGAHINLADQEDRARVQNFLNESKQKSNIIYRIPFGPSENSSVRHVSHRISHLDIPGKRRIVIHSLSDVTATVQAELQKLEFERQLVHTSKLASLGTMGAGVAHELNNPITVIKGYMERIRGELLKTLEENHSLIANVDKVLKHVGRMRTITDQLRVFSRRETKPEEWVVLPVERLIQDALDLQRHLLSGSQIELLLEIPEPSPSIMVIPTNFESVIQNLVGNAYDAHVMRQTRSEQGEGTRPPAHLDNSASSATGSGVVLGLDSLKPFIKVKVGELGLNKVFIEVTDNAGGIPGAILSQIFDPFFTTKESGKGTGLGLALVQSIVTNHKGVVYCTSKEGYGTTFSIQLPKAQNSLEKERALA